jgi:hypothetical protein
MCGSGTVQWKRREEEMTGRNIPQFGIFLLAGPCCYSLLRKKKSGGGGERRECRAMGFFFFF